MDGTPPKLESFRLGYRKELDGLRGVAILIVVLGHLGIVPLSRVGVDLFFVLSGFLITSLLLEEVQKTGDLDLRGFYKRRALRLLPALGLFILGYALFAGTGRFAGWLSELWWVLTYTTNVGIILQKIPLDGAFGICWSLAVEEQFYILWPIVFLLIVKGRAYSKLTPLLTSFIVSMIGWRWYLITQGATADRVYYGTDTHGQVILMGCLLASTLHAKQVTQRLPSVPGWLQDVAVLGILVVLSCTPVTRPFYVLWMNFYGALLTLVVWGAVNHRQGVAGKVLRQPWLTWFGKISYGLYLYHWPPLVMAYPYRKDPKVVLGVFSLAVALAAISYYGVERHFLGWKKPRSERSSS